MVILKIQTINDMYKYTKKNNMTLLSDFSGEFWKDYRDNYTIYDRFFRTRYKSFYYFDQDISADISVNVDEFREDINAFLYTNRRNYADLYALYINDVTLDNVALGSTVIERKKGDNTHESENEYGERNDTVTATKGSFHDTTVRDSNNVYGERTDTETVTKDSFTDTTKKDTPEYVNSVVETKGAHKDVLIHDREPQVNKDVMNHEKDAQTNKDTMNNSQHVTTDDKSVDPVTDTVKHDYDPFTDTLTKTEKPYTTKTDNKVSPFDASTYKPQNESVYDLVDNKVTEEKDQKQKHHSEDSFINARKHEATTTTEEAHIDTVTHDIGKESFTDTTTHNIGREAYTDTNNIPAITTTQQNMFGANLITETVEGGDRKEQSTNVRGNQTDKLKLTETTDGGARKDYNKLIKGVQRDVLKLNDTIREEKIITTTLPLIDIINTLDRYRSYQDAINDFLLRVFEDINREFLLV